VLWSIPGAIVSGLLSIPFARWGAEALRAAESGSQTPKIRGAALATIGGIAYLGAATYGAIRGWGKARKGEEQFNELKSQRNELNARNQAMETQVQGLNEEVGMNRKRFTETISSRSAHGSHKDAAHHDKKHSATAEVGA
jgi:cell division protein FtsB